MEKRTHQRRSLWRQPSRSGLGCPSVHSTPVYASGWAGYESLFYRFYEKAKSRGWKASEVNCGHDVMLDQANALTTLLLNTL